MKKLIPVHPNVIGYFASACIDSYFIIAMEWMTGLLYIIVNMSAFVNFFLCSSRLVDVFVCFVIEKYYFVFYE